MNRPPSGSMVWWRFKDRGGEYRFGYCTYVDGPNMIRLGRWNGDSSGGSVVSAYDIEWRPHG
jgi:hypothetical protein